MNSPKLSLVFSLSCESKRAIFYFVIIPGSLISQVQGVLGERKNCEPTVAKRQMSRRFGEPAETAAAIAFLCSKDASYITGTELAVDGGKLALGPEALGE